MLAVVFWRSRDQADWPMADPDPAVAAVAPVMSWMVLASLYASRASLIRPTSAAWLRAAAEPCVCASSGQEWVGG